MTTAEKMRFFQENADARKAEAIENNSFYGENLIKAQKSTNTDVNYFGAKNAIDSNAVRHAYDLDKPGSFPGTGKAGVTENKYFKAANASLNKKSDPNAHLKNKAYLDYKDAQDPSMNRKKSKQDLP